MPGKVILPKGKIFYVENDQVLDHQPWFSKLTKRQKEALDDWIGIFGTEDGFDIASMGGEQGGGSIKVNKEGIVFDGAREEQWIGMRFDPKTPAVIFLEGNIRILPVTESEMKAELSARQKRSRREK